MKQGWREGGGREEKNPMEKKVEEGRRVSDEDDPELNMRRRAKSRSSFNGV